MPTRGLPNPPNHLNRVEKKFYRDVGRELDAMGVMTTADGMALELASMAYAEMRACREYIQEHGIAYAWVNRGGGKSRKPMPEVTIGSAARKELRSWLQEFGLTPSSRSRVEVIREVEEDAYEAFAQSEMVKRQSGD